MRGRQSLCHGRLTTAPLTNLIKLSMEHELGICHFGFGKKINMEFLHCENDIVIIIIVRHLPAHKILHRPLRLGDKCFMFRPNGYMCVSKKQTKREKRSF